MGVIGLNSVNVSDNNSSCLPLNKWLLWFKRFVDALEGGYLHAFIILFVWHVSLFICVHDVTKFPLLFDKHQIIIFFNKLHFLSLQFIKGIHNCTLLLKLESCIHWSVVGGERIRMYIARFLIWHLSLHTLFSVI